MRLNNDRQNIESAIIFLLEKRSFRLDNKMPMENESDFLIAFLLVNSILSIPLKLNEREKNGIVNLRVKRQGMNKNFIKRLSIEISQKTKNVCINNF